MLQQKYTCNRQHTETDGSEVSKEHQLLLRNHSQGLPNALHTITYVKCATLPSLHVRNQHSALSICTMPQPRLPHLQGLGCGPLSAEGSSEREQQQ